jgi:hypothetical protein
MDKYRSLEVRGGQGDYAGPQLRLELPRSPARVVYVYGTVCVCDRVRL